MLEVKVGSASWVSYGNGRCEAIIWSKMQVMIWFMGQDDRYDILAQEIWIAI
jgi:hypothetical protein